MSAPRKSSLEPITRNFPRNSLDALTSSIPMNLPALHGQIIGREKEMRAIQDLLSREDTQLVTLTGFGGAGKTTLSLYAAHSMLERFSGGLFFIDLSSITDPALIPFSIAKTLNVQEEPQRELKDTLKDFLINRSILFLLDNFEQVIDGAPFVAEFLNANPNIKIIVTSREALRLRGEQVLSILPLPRDDAMQLFVKRAQTLNPDFRLTEDNTPAVSELCGRLDGLPLAIELAAMRTKLFTPQALLSRFQSDLGPDSPILNLLTSGPRDLPVRQQTLRAAIAWSYSLLNATEQRMLRVASLYSSGFGFESLFSVAGIPEKEVLESLSSLVDKNLVQARPEDVPRFSMLETIREFAREQSFALGEFESDKDSLIQWSLKFVEQAADGLEGSRQNEWLARLDAEHGNLTTVLDWCSSSPSGTQNWKIGYSLLDHLHKYWMMRAYFNVTQRWILRGRVSAEEYEKTLPKPSPELGEALRIKASIYSLSGSFEWARGNYTGGRDWHMASYKLYEKLADTKGIANALNNLGVNFHLLGDYKLAYKYHRKGLSLIQQVGDRWGEMRQLNNLGNTLRDMERLDEAFQFFENGLNLARELDDLFFVAAFLSNMGHLYVLRGEYNLAVDLLNQSMVIAQEINSALLHSWSLAMLGKAELHLGHTKEASSAIADTLRRIENLTDIGLMIVVFEVAASICIRNGNHVAAVKITGAMDSINSTSPATLYSPDFKLFNAKLHQQVRAQEYQTAWNLGAKMSIQETIAFISEQLEKHSRLVSEGAALSLLTVRELDTLRLLAQGKSNDEISRELVVVHKTVEKHVANILRKLGVKNRTEAAAWAIENEVTK